VFISVRRAFLGVFLCGICLAQSAVAPSQDSNFPTLTLRASSHLVLLDVVVTDKTGKPVPGLRVADFSVKEDGKPQAVSFVNAPTTAMAEPPPALPPGVYSNAPAYRVSGTPLVIVLDAANTSYSDQLYARTQMLAYLRGQYKPGQRVAIFTLTDKLSLLQDFTGDSAVLAAGLSKFSAQEPAFAKADSGSEPDLQGVRFSSREQYVALVSALERFQKSQSQYTIDRRAEVTLDALRRINRILGGLPGRKNVVWVTGGFPFMLDPGVSSSPATELSDAFRHPGVQAVDPYTTGLSASQRSLYADEIREIAAELAGSQVAVYPVDARGLVASLRPASPDQLEAMREIARETGGKAFVNRNDIESGVGLAEADGEAAYTIGYYPTNKKFDHQFRTVEVKLNRSGVEMTYRRGYFAEDTFSRSQEQLDRSLSEAWQDGAPDTMITFEAKVNSPDNGKARVDFLVDANTLSFAEEAGGRKLDVSFYVAACSGDNKLLAVKGARLARVFPLQIHQQMVREGIRLHLDADMAPGATQFRIAVRDNRTGYIGTLFALPSAQQ